MHLGICTPLILVKIGPLGQPACVLKTVQDSATERNKNAGVYMGEVSKNNVQYIKISF